MATKVPTNNIFASLQDDSDNEAPVAKNVAKATTTAAKAPVATTDNKAAQQTGNRQPRGQGRGERREGGAGNADNTQRKDNTLRPKHSREEQKPKGVPAEPHPQDRKSGTGYSGVEKKFRRDGAGRGNYGTVKSEVQEINKGDAPKVEEVVAVVEPVEEEPVVVDNTITVEEYFQRLGVSKDAPVQAPVERPLNLEELKRDKLVVVSSRSDKVLDAVVKKSAKAQNKSNPTYLLGCNTDHSELLGVKTGQTLVKYTVKMEGNELVGEEKRAPVAATQQQAPRENNRANNKQPRNLKKVVVESETDFPKLA